MSEIRYFQITDIVSDDFKVGKHNSEFVVTVYGKDTEGENVVCHVKGYQPYVYLKVPDWCQSVSEAFIDEEVIGNADQAPYHKERVKRERTISYTKCKEFYGFHWDEATNGVQTFQFLKLEFLTYQSLKKCVRWIRDCYARGMDESHADYDNLHESYGGWFRSDSMKTTPKCDCNLYESFVHPVVRFIHETKIEPTGWVAIKQTAGPDTGLFGEDDEIWCTKEGFKPHDSTQVSEYTIASFDIECDSSHGDFPQTSKYYKKLATDLFDSCNRCYSSEKMYISPILTNNPVAIVKALYKMLRVGFGQTLMSSFSKKHPEFAKAEINPVFTVKDAKPTTPSLLNIAKLLEPLFPKLFPSEKPVGKERDSCIREIHRSIQYNLKDKAGNAISEAGDPVIQIGTVFHDYGTDNIIRHVIVCGPDEEEDIDNICDNIPGITVVRCKTEAELLTAWMEVIKDKNPDFITGYNIFGFDFRYLIERAEFHFGKGSRGPTYEMRKHFMNLGKIENTEDDAKYHYSKKCQTVEKELTSSALGENKLHYIQMDGRIIFDIQKEVMKGHQLESYKLDNVAAHFMRGTVTEVDEDTIVTEAKTLKVGDFVSFRTHSNIGEQLHKSGHKYQILAMEGSTLTMSEPLDLSEGYHKLEWCLNKDDITPQDIFDKHKLRGREGAKGRAEVAKYCVQDCELCINLLLLLDIVPNNLAMANVSNVPASYIFLRGQGVKVSSVMAKVCGEENTRIPDLRKSPFMRDYIKEMKGLTKLEEPALRDHQIERLQEIHANQLATLTEQSQVEEKLQEHSQKIKGYSQKLKTLSKEDLIKEAVKNSLRDDNSKFGPPKDWILEEWVDEAVSIHNGEKGMEGYEGAIVLDPKPGLYLDDPIAVLDYASLYPSSIIEMNISHETQVYREMIDKGLFREDDCNVIHYVNWVYRLKGKGNTVEKVKSETDPTKTCYFLKEEYLEKLSGSGSGKGIVPKVLAQVLQARSDTKKRMKAEKDDVKYKVLDGLQLAYKVTANSVYGQLGARTSTVYKMDLAACTTAVGRDRIEDAEEGVKHWASRKGYEKPDVVYGDTDSVFVKFSRKVNGTLLTGKEALKHCIQCGIEAGDYVTKGKLLLTDEEGVTTESIETHAHILHEPQDLEYEKTFWPFILISKKRYTGDKYVYKPTNPTRTSMGIVLKRRDNAPIVKYVFGNVIEMIMVEKDFEKVKTWLKDTLRNICKGKDFDLMYFVITKALRGYYKNPRQIAHKVLADRMAERDPGNKPKANDRIAYAYIKLDQAIEYDHNKPYKSGIRKGRARENAILQGDRIEHVDYIKAHNLKLDYQLYITNQIMNPVKQVLDLRMDPKESEALFAEFLKQAPIAEPPVAEKPVVEKPVAEAFEPAPE